MLMLKNPVFFQYGVKNSLSTIFNFSQFHEKNKSRSFFKRSKKMKQLFRMHSQKCESHQIFEEESLI